MPSITLKKHIQIFRNISLEPPTDDFGNHKIVSIIYNKVIVRLIKESLLTEMFKLSSIIMNSHHNRIKWKFMKLDVTATIYIND